MSYDEESEGGYQSEGGNQSEGGYGGYGGYGEYQSEEGGDQPSGWFGGDDSEGEVRPWEQEQQPQFQDLGRVSFANAGFWEITKDGKKAAIQTPVARFSIKVDAVSISILNDCNGMIGSKDITSLLQHAQELVHVGYKNPTAFVLGYIATNKGIRLISKEYLNEVYDCYLRIRSQDKDDSVTKPDIIRYARLWNNIHNESKELKH